MGWFKKRAAKHRCDVRRLLVAPAHCGGAAGEMQ